jgi:hypothetical protein
MRARAAHLATLELGPPRDLELRDLDNQVEADRWTKLDHTLAGEAAQHDRVVDLRPGSGPPADGHARSAMIARMRKLEHLGLAEPLGPARWSLAENAEPTMRALGERTDIIKRIHRGLAAHRIERSVSDFMVDGSDATRPIVGQLVARGLDDELTGTAYAVINGVDGRAHHVRLADLDAAGDTAPGGIVELRRFDDATGRQRIALVVRSDLTLAAQVQADGPTWLDRQILAREPPSLSSGGFGREVREAMDVRVEHLVGEGLARRQGQRIVFARNLLATLRQRELEAAGAQVAASAGMPYRSTKDGEAVAGVYRRRLNLASGRFAMIDDGFGFSLVPWSPSLERHIGRHVSGIAQAGGIDWSFGRARGPAIG